MAFEKIEAPVKSTGRSAKMSCRETKHAVLVHLSVPVEYFAEPDSSPEAKYDITYGTGDDSGLVRVAPDKDGAFTPRIFTGKYLTPDNCVLCFNLGEPAFAPDGKQKPTKCAHRTSGNAVLISLPRWAFTGFEEKAASGEDEGAP